MVNGKTVETSALTPDTCIPGRLQIMGFVEREAPLDSARYCYERCREYGLIG